MNNKKAEGWERHCVSLVSIKEVRVPQVILEGERSWLTDENEEVPEVGRKRHN